MSYGNNNQRVEIQNVYGQSGSKLIFILLKKEM